MKVLVACEFSGVVRQEFNKLGHDAWSCDLLETEIPGNHIKGDVSEPLRDHWDLIIAHPPCTYLTVTGNRWFNTDKYGDKALDRIEKREEAIKFFMLFANSKCQRTVIENPVGFISTRWRKPNQIIQPYYFGDPEKKTTCLWLKGVNKLTHRKSQHVQPEVYKFKNRTGSCPAWSRRTLDMPKRERSHERSRTYPGIARAMAEQWGGLEK